MPFNADKKGNQKAQLFTCQPNLIYLPWLTFVERNMVLFEKQTRLLSCTTDKARLICVCSTTVPFHWSRIKMSTYGHFQSPSQDKNNRCKVETLVWSASMESEDANLRSALEKLYSCHPVYISKVEHVKSLVRMIRLLPRQRLTGHVMCWCRWSALRLDLYCLLLSSDCNCVPNP